MLCIICILTTKSVTKNNIFIKKEGINSESICYEFKRYVFGMAFLQKAVKKAI